MATPALRGSATVANSLSTSFSVNKPSGVVADDLMLSLQFADVGIGAVTSGWTQLRAVTTSNMHSRVAMRAAGGSEGASYTFTQTDGSDGGAIIIALSDVLAGQTPVSDTSTAGSGNNITTPSVTPLGADDFEIRFAVAFDAVSFTPPAGFVEQADVASRAIIAGACATRTLTSSGGTGTADFTVGSTPAERHGYTITVSGLSSASRRVFVSTAAGYRAANW